VKKRLSPLPLSFNNPIPSFNFSPSHQPQGFLSPIFFALQDLLSLSTSILKCFAKMSIEGNDLISHKTSVYIVTTQMGSASNCLNGLNIPTI